MKLIYSPASPFVRKVAVYTHLGNLTDKTKNFKVIGETLRYKDFYIFSSSIKRDFLDEFSSNNPSAVII